jgi:hypothetical protein
VKNAQKPDHTSLNTLIGWLKQGRFVIPDFQREFEWEPWDISELMRSIFLDYYIGSLLLWKSKSENFDALACEQVYGYEGSPHPEHIVLDGQQRLTAMYYAFTAPDIPAPGRANRYLYFIHVDRFMDEDYDEAFQYRWRQNSLKLFEDPTSQYEDHIFPLSIMGQGGFELPIWLMGYESHWRTVAEQAQTADNQLAAERALRHAEKAHEFGQNVREITEQYQVSYIELGGELPLNKICDIFTQINSKGIRLDVFDLINALLTPKGLRLKHMWRDAAPDLSFVETDRMNVYILQVMSILKQAYCSPKYLYYLLPGQEKSVRDADGSLRAEVLVHDAAAFRDQWNAAVKALGDAIALLRQPQEFGAISSQYLPYISILPAFAALQKQAGAVSPNRQLDAQRKIRHWYWASVFTNRYSGAMESTTARDFQDVKAWFDDDSAQPALIDEFESRFRSLDLRREVRRGTSIYNGIFNLLVIRGARDWMTGKLPQAGDLDDHHIVPKDWGKGKELFGTSIDTILNRTPLTADTNRKVIRNRLPNVYLPELIKENGENRVRGILESHFISPSAFQILRRDPFTVQDFEAFLAERQRTLQEAIEDLLIKERLDLAPQLRELDERVERVERALRSLVETTVNDASGLPSHVAQKVTDRVQASAKKNPAVDLVYYGTLTGMLEYFDLRELKDTIMGKQNWSSFEPTFVNKETLETKFGQLAELRNCIRHTRVVDEITRKEGEAALLWFEKMLDK